MKDFCVSRLCSRRLCDWKPCVSIVSSTLQNSLTAESDTKRNRVRGTLHTSCSVTCSSTARALPSPHDYSNSPRDSDLFLPTPLRSNAPQATSARKPLDNFIYHFLFFPLPPVKTLWTPTPVAPRSPLGPGPAVPSPRCPCLPPLHQG